MYNDYGYQDWNGYKSIPHQVMDNLTDFKKELCKTINVQTEKQAEVGNKINDSIVAQTAKQDEIKRVIVEQTAKQEQIRQAILAQTQQQKADAEQHRSVIKDIATAIRNIVWK